jgi:hypothetical protein
VVIILLVALLPGSTSTGTGTAHRCSFSEESRLVISSLESQKWCPPLPLLVFLAPLLLFLGVLQTQRILAGSAAICWQRHGLLAATAAFRRTESVRVPAGDGDGDGGEGRPEGLEGWAGHHCDVVAGERSR